MAKYQLYRLLILLQNIYEKKKDSPLRLCLCFAVLGGICIKAKAASARENLEMALTSRFPINVSIM